MRKSAYWAVALLVVAVVALVVVGCGTKSVVSDPVAKVNDQTISANEYLDLCSKAAGKQVLSNLIEQSILLQWAKDEDVPVTDEQVNKQIETLKRDDLYDDQVKFMGEEGLKSQIKAMQARANLVNKTAKPSDSDVKMAYDMMKSRMYVHGPRTRVALVVNTDKDKLEEAIKKAKDGEDFDKVATDYNSMGGGAIKVWVEDNQPMVPKDLLKAVKSAKVGDVVGPFNMSQPGQVSQWVALKVLKTQGKTNMKLADVKDEVANTAAVQKFGMDPDLQKKFNEKKKDAKIEINDTSLAEVAGQFKNPPEPNPMMSMPRRAPGPAPKAAPAKP